MERKKIHKNSPESPALASGAALSGGGAAVHAPIPEKRRSRRLPAACDGFRLRSSLASLEQETNAQRTYVEQARMRYGQTRAFRHDIKNHLSVLDGLLRSGQAERARELPAEAGGSVHGPFISNPDRQSCDGCPAGG